MIVRYVKRTARELTNKSKEKHLCKGDLREVLSGKVYNSWFSMKKLPQQVRLQYWKYQFASLTFYDVSEVAEFLKSNPKTKLKYPLLTSLYVLYGRPFRQREPVRLSEDIVPSEYIKVHGCLMVLRDKLFAHVDLNAPPDWEVKHLSKIWIGYRNGMFKPGFAQLLSGGFQFDTIKALSLTLYKLCHAKSEDILQDAMDGTKLPTQITYEVDISEGEKYLLKHREIREHGA